MLNFRNILELYFRLIGRVVIRINGQLTGTEFVNQRMGEMKILIVEDEPDIVELLAYNLQQAGFETDALFNDTDVVQQVKRHQPDLILLDLMLPEIDGFEVYRLLKGQSETKSIPIIMLTAKTDEIDCVLGLALGADDYITKPFSLQEVVLRIRAVLRHTVTAQPTPTQNTLEYGDLALT